VARLDGAAATMNGSASDADARALGKVDALCAGALAAHHALDRFDSASPRLMNGSKRPAAVNQTGRASRTYVACDAGQSSAITHSHRTPLQPWRNGACPPQHAGPVPAVVLGRLRFARSHQGQGLGRALFRVPPGA